MENINLYCDKEIKDKIEQLAKDQNRSMSNLIEFIILDYFKKKGELEGVK